MSNYGFVVSFCLKNIAIPINQEGIGFGESIIYTDRIIAQRFGRHESAVVAGVPSRLGVRVVEFIQ